MTKIFLFCSPHRLFQVFFCRPLSSCTFGRRSVRGGILTESAEAENIYVFRSESANSINVYHLNAGNPMALVFGDQFALRPGDIVFVDATGLARWNRVIKMVLPTAQFIYYGSQSVHMIHTAKDDIVNW